MNVCGHLLILRILLFDFQDIFCNEFSKRKYPLPGPNGHDEISGGGFFKFWRNPKPRRSVKSVGDGRLTTGDQTPQIKPQFECGDRVLTVFLKHADVINLRIYGPLGNLFPLDQLAAFCGVSIKTTRTDVRMLFSYDSCYVKQEETGYILSLSWYGTVHVLSCPASVTPPSVVCKNDAMEMTVVGDGTADKLSVALNGEWVPLLYVATECWHREPSNQGELTFSVPYTSCGVNFRGDRFILDLRSKDKMISLSCPLKPIPVFPVKDSGLSETTQPLPQKQPSVYHKPPTVFPMEAIDSQIVKQEQVFPVEHLERSASRTRSLHPRGHWLPKLPSLPGSFNLAVNFPFSIPIPTQPVPLRDHLTSKPVVPTPAPTPAPTPTPAPVSTSTQQPHLVSHEQMEEELAAPVTKAPKSQHRYMQYPYKFQKPVSAPQFEPYSAQKYHISRVPVHSTSLYQPFGSAQNYNVPRPNPLQVNPSLASLAQYLPPGYFICSYNQQPEIFQPPVPNPAQPLQSQKPSYQRPDLTLLTPANPAAPPMKGYSQPQLTSAVASSSYDSGSQHFQPTQHFQPSQHHPYSYQSSYGHQSSTTTHLSPTSPLIPTNLQSQTRRYLSYPAFQDVRPFHPEYYQKPSQPSGLVQQPWSTSHLPVKGLFQESKPLALASSHTPEYLKYQTGGEKSLDLYQRSVVHTSGIGSHSQYQPSQFTTFPHLPLRPEVISADVSMEDTGTSPKGFFQPRSIAPVPSPQAPTFTGSHPTISFPQPMPRFFPVKEGAQVAQLPYSQGPSVRGMQNPHVHPERPSEPSSQNPQNATLPPYQFYRRDVFVSPQFRSTSQEEVQLPRKASHSESYFYSPSADEAHN